MKHSFLNKGFTLIELLVVVGIIAVLAVTVFLVLDPVARSQNARNSQRLADVTNIFSAVNQSIDENNGSFPEGVFPGMYVTQIGTAGSGCDTTCSIATASACVNLNSVFARYLQSVPVDPQVGTDINSGYAIVMSDTNRITVSACAPENDLFIQVSQ